MEAENGDVLPMSALEFGYAAVPIITDNAERMEYRQASILRIRRRLVRALLQLDTSGEWARSGDRRRRIRDLVDTSLITSHEHRLGFPLHVDALVDPSDERLTRAQNGEADPTDLLTLLADYPALYSIELAKLSHPFDAAAPEPMNRDVLQTIDRLGGTLSEEPAYYRRKTLDKVIPAVTLLRKQVVGTVLAPAGSIRVMHREAFLVRGDPMAREIDPELCDMVLDKARLGDLGAKVEAYYPHLREHPDLTWLQPIASSYYAKYTDLEAFKE